MNRLNVIAVDEKKPSAPTSVKRTRREEFQAKFERMWREDPEQFDPMCNCIERERLKRSMDLLTSMFDPSGKKIVDLGCGKGDFAQLLVEQGASVDGVDIATLALQRLPPSIRPIHDCMPSTTLPDDFYDLVVCMDLIAYFPQKDHRLFMAELSRLVNTDGYVLLSTPLDSSTEEPLGLFLALVETEFDILGVETSSHALMNGLTQLLDMPSRFVRDSHSNANYFWRTIRSFFAPISNFLQNRRLLVLFMEQVTRFVRSRLGITHVIIVVKRRSIKFI